MKAWWAAALLLLAAPAGAVLPSEQLADPVLEARARAISAQIRCVVCQNQSIDDSDAPLAHNLRVIVRERLVAGDSDQQAIQYLVDRYGHYVLLKPPFEPATLALWLAPAALLVGGGVGIAVMVQRKHRAVPAADLDAAEAAEVARLLGTNE
jgi:cytochrome c-type biogenesis protein CcmH